MKKAVFPGSFDPFTKGHESIIEKGLTIFDEIIIGIGANSKKSYLFSNVKRVKHIQSIYLNNPRIQVLEYNGLTTDFCTKLGATHILRGLRNSNDYIYEQTIAQMNKTIANIESVFFNTDAELTTINSSIVREIFLNNGDISKFVTNHHWLV